MSTSRRAFFKGLIGGVGALGLGSVILSRRGWFGILGSTEAFAQPGPSTYFELKDNFTFFEAYKKGNAPTSIPPFLREIYNIQEGAEETSVLRRCNSRRDRWPNHNASAGPNEQKPLIIDLRANKKYELNDSGAYITRLLLMDVNIEFLAKLYVSRFGGTEQEALRNIRDFMTAPPDCWRSKHISQNPTAPPGKTPKEFTEKIWADFSVGSVWVGGIKIPA
jgi:hypothetical protein